MSAETPWVQRYIDDGWQWRRKARGTPTPHLVRDARTLCGRSSVGLDTAPAMTHGIGCLSCRDIAGGIIFGQEPIG